MQAETQPRLIKGCCEGRDFQEADTSVLNRNASALKASDGLHQGFPGASDGTESACDAGDQVFTRDRQSIMWENGKLSMNCFIF